MKQIQGCQYLLISLCTALLAGCAAAPTDQAAGADAPTVVAAAGKCKVTEVQTGSSIQRKDCSGGPDVKSVDPKEFMDTRRTATPSK
jgi:uncharacterized lipoprotein YajG